MSTQNPRMSIVMVDGSFRESFHAVDFFCQQNIPTEDFELLWVEFYEQVNPRLQEKIDKYPNARVITLAHPADQPYHSSYCFNAGIQASRGELILIPDGDLVAEPDLLEQVWAEHQTDDRLAMYLFRYEEPDDQHEDEPTLAHLKRVSYMRSPSNFGACLTIRKKWLLEINGYEQHKTFETHFHANGADVNTRLKNLGMHIMWHPTIKLYHPWHPFTKVADDDYLIQDIVIRHRAVTLMSTAFEGIDPAKNRPFPQELTEKVAQKRAELAEAAKICVLKADARLHSIDAPLIQKVRRRIGKLIGS